MNTFENIIKEYIETACKSDEVLAGKYEKSGKDIEGCCKYIKSQARKKAQNGCAVIADAEVFGWAMHYFEEDSIEEGKTYVETGVAVGVESAAEAKKKEDKPKIAEKPKKTKAQCDDQMSLLDLFG